MPRRFPFDICFNYLSQIKVPYLLNHSIAIAWAVWRTIEIVEAYTLRWLIEVFFQDWKANEGWGRLTKQPGEEGSSRNLILSLLIDHSLFFHPDQLAGIENNLPAFTVDSLTAKIKVEGTLALFEQIIMTEAPVERFKKFAKSVEDNVVVLCLSKKHMVDRDLGKF